MCVWYGRRAGFPTCVSSMLLAQALPTAQLLWLSPAWALSSVFSVSLAGGGVTDGHGESEAGAGVHEGEAVLHSAVAGWEGNASDQPPGWEKEALGGSSGDEVSIFTMFSTRSAGPHHFHLLTIGYPDPLKATLTPLRLTCSLDLGQILVK